MSKEQCGRCANLRGRFVDEKKINMEKYCLEDCELDSDDICFKFRERRKHSELIYL